ncbi:DNA-binding protein [Streptococcus bovimastitidis]|uniref:DNA-binding protein n=1 Tax=Streptococcus bovimastitidis TaxID=1856638 RepID=A0A1L8MKL6_9STRE|nr:DNA-binding protein [Streptococcus bovimastitidis]OJF71261.1 DNA-binding protein [Streptococcus bovimastitidis]
MKVDTDKIDWLLKNETQYKITKDTGVAQVTLSGLISGKRKIENLTVKVASKLTEYAEEIQNIK